MLKLYNIYKSIILEDEQDVDLVQGQDLSQEEGPQKVSPTIQDVMNVIKNHNFVDIWYDGEPQKRYCQVYNLGTTSRGNPAIRVFQVSGPSKRKNQWKTLRLDKIKWTIKPKMRFYRPVDKTAGYTGPSYDPTGDKTLSWGGNVVTSNFND